MFFFSFVLVTQKQFSSPPRPPIPSQPHPQNYLQFFFKINYTTSKQTNKNHATSPKIVSVLLAASVERVVVSCMRDFLPLLISSNKMFSKSNTFNGISIFSSQSQHLICYFFYKLLKDIHFKTMSYVI